MDKVLCHFYANTYYDEWRVIITDYTDGKKPIWDNASSEGIRAYDASTSQSCFIYNSAIFAGSPEPSYHVVNVCLLANEAFTLKIQYKRSQDSEWMEGNTQNYNKLNNGFYTVSSSPITIKSSVTDLRTTTIISSGFDNSKPVTSELDIPIFSDYSEYGQFVLSPAPSASVEVSYDIPEGDYDYVKLVFKKDRIPADVNDGYAVDLDPTAHSVEVSGLSKTLGTKYYFAIFTDKSVGDEFPYEVGQVPPRFRIPKQMTFNNTKYTLDMPEWMEEKILETFENNTYASAFSVGTKVTNPDEEPLWNRQSLPFPLQFRIHRNGITGEYSYPDGYPTKINYSGNSLRLEWGFDEEIALRNQKSTTYYYGSWWMEQGSALYEANTIPSGYSVVYFPFFVLDNQDKKGYMMMCRFIGSANDSGFLDWEVRVWGYPTNGTTFQDVSTAIYEEFKGQP